MTADAPIESPANPRIKAAIALRKRTEREATGMTLVDGNREIRRALDAGVEIAEAFAATGAASSDDMTLLSDLRAARIRVTEVSDRAMARLAFGERAGSIVARVRFPATGLELLEVGADPLVVVVDAVEKPGNLGAILRSADGAGVDALVLADPGTDPSNPNVIRASLGTVFTVPIAVTDGPAARAWLAGHGIRVVTARVDAPLPYTAADLRGPMAIVLGPETTGLSDDWSAVETTAVAIPMHGVADSLNVSVTAGILLYEARRQRDARADP
jgi:TrmH family RNA methyltransferase